MFTSEQAIQYRKLIERLGQIEDSKFYQLGMLANEIVRMLDEAGYDFTASRVRHTISKEVRWAEEARSAARKKNAARVRMNEFHSAWNKAVEQLRFDALSALNE